MKITDALINMILKKGLLMDMKKVDTTFEIPIESAPDAETGAIFMKTLKINVKAENLTIKVEKD